MDWDTSGRLWVVEMPGFMADLTGSNEHEPIGRVVVLEDTNGDGRMDKRTVFADRLVLARSIKVLDRGVLIAEPPNVWLMSDDDGDLKADRRTLVTDRYGRRDADPQNNANGFHWALDNRMYTAGQADIHLRLVDGRFETTRTLQRGEWGVTEDDAGRIYRNTNESAVHVDVVPTHYYARNPSLVRTRGSYERLATGNEDLNIVWPVRPNPGTNRAYQAGIDRPDGTLFKFTSVCAPTVYRGDRLPAELYGNVFVAEPAANLVARLVLEDGSDGLTARKAYPRGEFLASTDERFRPVYLVQCARRHALHCRPVPRHHRAPHLHHRIPARSDSRAPPRSRHRLRPHLSRGARDDGARRRRAAAKRLDRRARESVVASERLVARHRAAPPRRAPRHGCGSGARHPGFDCGQVADAAARAVDAGRARCHRAGTRHGRARRQAARSPQLRDPPRRALARTTGTPGRRRNRQEARRQPSVDSRPARRVPRRAACRATRGSAREAAAARR